MSMAMKTYLILLGGDVVVNSRYFKQILLKLNIRWQANLFQ